MPVGPPAPTATRRAMGSSQKAEKTVSAGSSNAMWRSASRRAGLELICSSSEPPFAAGLSKHAQASARNRAFSTKTGTGRDRRSVSVSVTANDTHQVNAFHATSNKPPYLTSFR